MRNRVVILFLTQINIWPIFLNSIYVFVFMNLCEKVFFREYEYNHDVEIKLCGVDRFLLDS